MGVGEQTGKIAPALQRGAMKYDKEFSSQIQRLTILIQPITIMAVAIFVGVVAYSMITGILLDGEQHPHAVDYGFEPSITGRGAEGMPAAYWIPPSTCRRKSGS